MPFSQNIPINITPESVWAVLDAAESDFDDNLANVMDDSGRKFVVEDEQKDNDKDEDQEGHNFRHNSNSTRNCTRLG